jgi:hypothetical protein
MLVLTRLVAGKVDESEAALLLALDVAYQLRGHPGSLGERRAVMDGGTLGNGLRHRSD